MRTVYLATVHWRSSEWIDLQINSLSRFCSHPTKRYAFLNQIDDEFSRYFDHFRQEDGISHAEKLNILATDICNTADPNDIILFMDGDAFPIASIDKLISQLQDYPLIAVQRIENNGDKQPHPCFCITTVGFWQRIGGDWNPGGYWKNRQGAPVTDVGGLLLENLEARDIKWLSLVRSNKRNLHPLWFGVYANVVYHHGAGFRDKLCRLDALHGVDLYSKFIINLQKLLKLQRRQPNFNALVTKHIHDYMRRKNAKLADKVFSSIKSNQAFAIKWGLVDNRTAPEIVQA